MFAVTLASSLALGIAVVGLSWKYRRRREDQRSVPVGATPLFVALAVSIPLALFLSLFTVGFRDFVELQSPPADAMEVYVSAKQWVWEFAYGLAAFVHTHRATIEGAGRTDLRR